MAGGIAAQAALLRVLRYTGVSLRWYRLSRFNWPIPKITHFGPKMCRVEIPVSSAEIPVSSAEIPVSSLRGNCEPFNTMNATFRGWCGGHFRAHSLEHFSERFRGFLGQISHLPAFVGISTP